MPKSFTVGRITATFCDGSISTYELRSDHIEKIGDVLQYNDGDYVFFPLNNDICFTSHYLHEIEEVLNFLNGE